MLFIFLFFDVIIVLCHNPGKHFEMSIHCNGTVGVLYSCAYLVTIRKFSSSMKHV